MERLRKWFGGSGDADSTHRKLEKGDNSEHRASDLTKSVETTVTTKAVTESQQANSQLPSNPSDANVTETRVGQLMNQGREMILRVIPLTEGDCLSCKLIGSGVMYGAAAFILFSYPKAKTRFTGYKSVFFTLQVGCLATGLTLLGTARLFDVGTFAPPDEDGKRKDVAELVTEDLNNFRKMTSKLFSIADNSDTEK